MIMKIASFIVLLMTFFMAIGAESKVHLNVMLGSTRWKHQTNASRHHKPSDDYETLKSKYHRLKSLVENVEIDDLLTTTTRTLILPPSTVTFINGLENRMKMPHFIMLSQLKADLDMTHDIIYDRYTTFRTEAVQEKFLNKGCK